MRDSKWLHFHEVPGILLIRLMSRCNERCLFCMVEDEIHGSDDVPFTEATARIDGQPPGTIIEFFGGEPTIYPRFLELLRHARERGFTCSIASNCRIFHSTKFTAAVAALGADELYVRTSLYGPDAALHDHYTAAPGSFRQTIAGIRNLVAEDILCQVNLVIMRDNLAVLEEMVHRVHESGAPRIKFGNLIGVATCRDHAVRLSEVRPHLMCAIELAESLGLSVTVEKTPVCVAGGRLDLMSAERDLFGGQSVHAEDAGCANCLVRRWCDGFDPDYVMLFGFDGLQPLRVVPARGVALDLAALPPPQFLKTYCIGIADAMPAPEEVAAIDRLLPTLQRQAARLVILPHRYLRGTEVRPAGRACDSEEGGAICL